MLPLKKILGSLNETNELAKPQEDKNKNTKNNQKTKTLAHGQKSLGYLAKPSDWLLWSLQIYKEITEIQLIMICVEMVLYKQG